MIILMIGLVITTINRFASIQEKITLTEKEISDLKTKTEFVNYKQQIIKEGIDIEQVNKVLTQLIPNEEDFFSIIFALEEISKKTNFLIIGYLVNLKLTTPEKLSLTIEGHGDQNTFFNFLKDYRFIGGRLITIDKIDYKTTGFISIKLNINFYSGKETQANAFLPAKLSEADKKLIKDILNKIEYQIKPEEDLSYPVKSNPF